MEILEFDQFWLTAANMQVLPLVPPGRKANEEGSPYSGQVMTFLINQSFNSPSPFFLYLLFLYLSYVWGGGWGGDSATDEEIEQFITMW